MEPAKGNVTSLEGELKGVGDPVRVYAVRGNG
jgi:hypothetical protein